MENNETDYGMFPDFGRIGSSMLETLGQGPGPTPEEMEREAQAALFNKKVLIDGVTVKTWDLSVPKEAKDYVKTVTDIWKGIAARTHVIFVRERKFVEQPHPRWIVHMEWAKYKLEVTANETVKGHAKESDRS